jgi:hypothetical protein
VNKERSPELHIEEFNVKKLNEVEDKEIEYPNRFAALGDLNTEVKLYSSLETIGENIKAQDIKGICYYELKEHKPWL